MSGFFHREEQDDALWDPRRFFTRGVGRPILSITIISNSKIL
jgi:hypothetical protein